jgi:hypothetical protein
VSAHRCIAGPACRQATIVDGERAGAMTIESETLCDPCLKHISDACRQLPRDYRMLSESIGDHQTGTVKVNSTPTPAIPINSAAEAVMARILEVAALAADVLSDQLKTNPPADRSRALAGLKLTHTVTVHGDQTFNAGCTVMARANSLADRATRTTRQDPADTLQRCISLVQPNIALLATIDETDVMLWRRPRRCHTHAGQIGSAETELTIARPNELEEARQRLNRAFAAAAACEDCNGWYEHGQARELATLTGLDICHQITKTHDTARAHLGHTRLRHHYDMPCPAIDKHGTYCGAPTLGRDNGSDWVDCTTCATQWTEREYNWLTTMIAGDKEIDMLRWLLAEAYWRLDMLKNGADRIRNDPLLDEPNSGQFVLDGIDIILNAGNGHQPPEKRKTTR